MCEDVYLQKVSSCRFMTLIIKHFVRVIATMQTRKEMRHFRCQCCLVKFKLHVLLYCESEGVSLVPAGQEIQQMSLKTGKCRHTTCCCCFWKFDSNAQSVLQQQTDVRNFSTPSGKLLSPPRPNRFKTNSKHTRQSMSVHWNDI